MTEEEDDLNKNEDVTRLEEDYSKNITDDSNNKDSTTTRMDEYVAEKDEDDSRNEKGSKTEEVAAKINEDYSRSKENSKTEEDVAKINKNASRSEESSKIEEDVSKKHEDDSGKNEDNTRQEENNTNIGEGDSTKTGDGSREVVVTVVGDAQIEENIIEINLDNGEKNKEQTENSGHSLNSDEENCKIKEDDRSKYQLDERKQREELKEMVSESNISDALEYTKDLSTVVDAMPISKDTIVLFDENIQLGADLGIPVEIIDLTPDLDITNALESSIPKNVGFGNLGIDSLLLVDGEKGEPGSSSDLTRFPEADQEKGKEKFINLAEVKNKKEITSENYHFSFLSPDRLDDDNKISESCALLGDKNKPDDCLEKDQIVITLPVVTHESPVKNLGSQNKVEQPAVISKIDPPSKCTIDQGKKENLSTIQSNLQATVQEAPMDLSSPSSVTSKKSYLCQEETQTFNESCVSQRNKRGEEILQETSVDLSSSASSKRNDLSQDISKSFVGKNDEVEPVNSKTDLSQECNVSNSACDGKSTKVKKELSKKLKKEPSKPKENIDLKAKEFLKAFKLDSLKEYSKTLNHLRKEGRRKFRKVRNRVSMIDSSDNEESSPQPKLTSPGKVKKELFSSLDSSYQPLTHSHLSIPISKETNANFTPRSPQTILPKKRPLSGSTTKGIGKRLKSGRSPPLTALTPLLKPSKKGEENYLENNHTSNSPNKAKIKNTSHTSNQYIPLGKPYSTPRVKFVDNGKGNTFDTFTTEDQKVSNLDRVKRQPTPPQKKIEKTPQLKKPSSQKPVIEIDLRCLSPSASLKTLEDVLNHSLEAAKLKTTPVQEKKSKKSASTTPKVLSKENSHILFETNPVVILSPLTSTPDKDNERFGSKPSQEKLPPFWSLDDDEDEMEHQTFSAFSRVDISSDDMNPDSRSPIHINSFNAQETYLGTSSTSDCRNTTVDQAQSSPTDQIKEERRCSVVLTRFDPPELKHANGATPEKRSAAFSNSEKPEGHRTKSSKSSIFSPKPSSKVKLDCEYCGLTFKNSPEYKTHNKVYHSAKSLFF